jgi:hypothetical protein
MKMRSLLLILVFLFPYMLKGQQPLDGVLFKYAPSLLTTARESAQTESYLVSVSDPIAFESWLNSRPFPVAILNRYEASG